jgi:hypothetical protein
VAAACGAAAARATSSFCWATVRSAASRSISACCSRKDCWTRVKAATAASWLACAPLTARSDLVFASLAAASELTAAVLAWRSPAMTSWELCASVCPAEAVAMIASGVCAKTSDEDGPLT